MEFLKTFRSKPLPSVKTTAPLLSPKIRIDWTFFVSNFWIHQELKTLCEGFQLDRFGLKDLYGFRTHRKLGMGQNFSPTKHTKNI